MTSMRSDHEADLVAVGIYGAMGHDVSDAVDMINECGDVRTLETLHAMLTTEGRPDTDQELNDLMAGPTKRRLDIVRGTRMTLEEALEKALEKSIPKVGDYEFCREIGGDGMFHMFIVSQVNGNEVRYMARCGNVSVRPISDYEVAWPAESCNCLSCML